VCFSANGGNTAVFDFNEDISFNFSLEWLNTVNTPSVSIIVLNKNMLQVMGRYELIKPQKTDGNLFSASLSCQFKSRLLAGNYFITLRLEERVSDNVFNIIEKQVGVLNFQMLPQSSGHSLGIIDYEIEIRPSESVQI
jgi:lipopolysaccharide transport system ATP-binding protein